MDVLDIAPKPILGPDKRGFFPVPSMILTFLFARISDKLVFPLPVGPNKRIFGNSLYGSITCLISFSFFF